VSELVSEDDMYGIKLFLNKESGTPIGGCIRITFRKFSTSMEIRDYNGWRQNTCKVLKSKVLLNKSNKKVKYRGVFVEYY
jgi:hypothetical protein